MTEAYATTAIASELGLEHAGPAVSVTGVDSLDRAGGEDLAFCVYDDPDYLAATDAGAVVCPPSIERPEGATVVYAERPKLAFAKATETFFEGGEPSGVHPTAVVEAGATVGQNSYVGPQAYVADCVTVGQNCTIRAGARLGGDGFGFARESTDELRRVPHRGSVRVEDGVEIGPNTTVDRAMFEETVIGAGSKLSGNVHLAHHVRIGRDTTVACHAGIAGGAVVGDRVTVHPHVSIATDVTVGDDAELAMNAAVLEDVEPGRTVAGSPARPIDGN